MRRDPEDLFELSADRPDLDGVPMLHHLVGFMDAGSAGRLLAEHLTSTGEPETVATFDVDRLIDYRSRRPTMIYSTDHWEEYEAPELVVQLLHDLAGAPFLLLTGPEPDHEWDLFAASVQAASAQLGGGPLIGFQGIPMGVPHTRPLGVISHATRPELIRSLTLVSPALPDSRPRLDLIRFPVMSLPRLGPRLVRQYQVLPPERRVADVITTCFGEPALFQQARFSPSV